MSFTDREKAECAEREVKQRQRVYARHVAAGKMSKEFADYQIAVMEEIAAEYRAKVVELPPAQGALL